MKSHQENARSGLVGAFVFVLTSQAYGQEVVPAPISEADRAKTNIAEIFAHRSVGRESATFVDPIAACERRFEGRTINGAAIDCRHFQMGSPSDEAKRDPNETQHPVYFTNTFTIQATEVTQLQWLMVMKGTSKAAPSSFNTDCDENNQETYRIETEIGTVETVTICKNHPVEGVSYIDITGPNGFLAKLNASQTQYTYRLPTEAEWEYSARGGEMKPDGTYPGYSFGDEVRDLDLFGWYGWHDDAQTLGNSEGRTHAVAGKQANGYGLFDVHGNVWEWVSDRYDHNYGLSAEQLAGGVTNPVGPSADYRRVFRGGSWGSFARHLRSAFRGNDRPSCRYESLGFRLVRTAR